MNSIIDNFFTVLGNQNKIKFLIFIILSFVGSILDIVSIGSIPIFVLSILDTEKFISFLPADLSYLFIDFKKTEFIIFLSILLAGIFAIKNLFMVFLIYFESNFIKNICINNGSKIFKKYLSSNVSSIIKYSQSKIIRNLTSENFQATEIIRSSLYLMREFLIILSLAVILIYTDPIISLIIFILLGFFSFLFFFLIKNKLKSKGNQAQIHRSNQIKSITEAYDFIREIKILNKENYVSNIFYNELTGQMNNNEYYNVVSKLPKFFLETLSIIGIVICCVIYIYLNREITHLIPILSLLAVSIVRLMPSFNLITATFSSISYYLPSLHVVSGELQKEQKDKEINQLAFADTECLIKLSNISFKYNKNDNVLNNVSIDINEGEKVLITGKTGSGKSTLLNIFLGFLKTSTGKILYSKKLGEDYKTFLSFVGYVPQEIYLIDDTIKKNITFGVKDDQVDLNRVEEVLDICQLRDELKYFQNGINTLVGNRGAFLSGGQKQRIAIARALYRDPKVLFFDEISSALDLETEKKLIIEICNKLKNKTIILISHSLQFSSIVDKTINLNKLK